MAYPEYLAWDCETSGATNNTFGNPFCDNNRLCVLGYGNSSRSQCLDLRGPEPIGPTLEAYASHLNEHKDAISVAFNWKFDAHWLRRYGIRIPHSSPVWDCQLAHFIIHDQQTPLPSLEACSVFYGLTAKFIDIETEYWNKGIDNDHVPLEILRERVEGDVRITSQLFETQCDILRREPSKKRLIWVSCQDQKVLEEMEWNGLKYDIELSLKEGDKIRLRQKEIEIELDDISGIQGCNWNSKDQLSAVLYGGTIKLNFKEDYTFVYKDGSSAPKTRWAVREIVCPRRVEPRQGTEYAKGGVFSSDADTLSKLKPSDKATRRILELIEEHRKLDKKVGTYYHGIPKLYKEMEWTQSLIHGSLQSAVTATGRLSSVKPNQQNMDHDIRKCIVSRFQ